MSFRPPPTEMPTKDKVSWRRWMDCSVDYVWNVCGKCFSVKAFQRKEFGIFTRLVSTKCFAKVRTANFPMTHLVYKINIRKCFQVKLVQTAAFQLEATTTIRTLTNI